MAIADSILSVCLNSNLKTHIMFKCNLNTRQLHDYIDSLLSNDLLETEREPSSARVKYRTTTKGRKFMEAYYDTIRLLIEQKAIEVETLA